MSFLNFKNTKTREELQVEIKVLERSLETSELTDGDKKVLEKSIIKLKGQLNLIEDTVSSDIVGVEQNLFGSCAGKAGCECSKCTTLKRPEISEALKEKSPFGNFFNK